MALNKSPLRTLDDRLRQEARQDRAKEMAWRPVPPTTDASVKRASAVLQLIYRATDDPTVGPVYDRWYASLRRLVDADHTTRLDEATRRWGEAARAACTGNPQYQACFDRVYRTSTSTPSTATRRR